MTAIAYIRQSARRDLDVALSPEQQEATVRRLAAADGFDDVTIYRDLGRSGAAGKEGARPGYQAMLAAIENGGVKAIYAKALSRIGRSVKELHRVMELADENGIAIVTGNEGRLDPTTAFGKGQFGMMAVFAQLERDLASERAKDNVAAAGLLNAAGVASWTGGTWTSRAVRNVIERVAPGDLPVATSRGVKPRSSFALARLMRCPHDGSFLTGYHDKRIAGEPVKYQCNRRAFDKAHPSPYRVREDAVLPWVMAEAAHLRTPDAVQMATTNEAKRAALAARRAKVVTMFEMGTIDTADLTERVRRIDAEAATLETEQRVVAVPSVNWDAPAGDLHAVLSALFENIELDASLDPVAATWRVPHWRA